jgi:WXG100 family type VII secretion target
VTGFRADLEALDELAARLDAVDRRAAMIAADLERDARLLDARWNGAAADRYDAAQHRWLRAHAALRDAAADLAGFVRSAHANYADAAAANARMWG